MRWLLLKDLQILRRSPLLVGLLIVYPIVIALLVGLALDRPPEKPKVAFANLVPQGESEFSIGGKRARRRRLRAAAVRGDRSRARATRARRRSRRSATARCSARSCCPRTRPSGCARTLGARRRRPADDRGLLQRVGPAEAPARRDHDPVARWPRPTTRSRTPCSREAAGYIDVIVTGGEVALPLVGTVDILGLRRSQAIIEAAVRSLPGGRAGARRARRRSRASRAWPPTTSTSPSRSSATIGSPVRGQADQRQRRRRPR